MGIHRVYGDIEGQLIEFKQNPETKLWLFTVPVQVDGEYVLSLWAEDFAGNVSYFSTILYTVKASQVVAILLELPYVADLLTGYSADCLRQDYEGVLV